MFDGYESTNTKDIRRSKGNTGITVTFTADMTLRMKKELFLSNRQNKQRFIFMSSEELQNKNCETHHASGDADPLIVQKAVQSADITNTVLVGDDADLLVLLCYHVSLESHDLFFCPEPKKNTMKHRVWNIKATKKMLGTDICKHILFLQAVLGYDTTSRLHGIGKGASLKKFKASNSFREQAKFFFYTYPASVCDVADAGEKALVIIYNGRSIDALATLRYHRCWDKVASSSSHVQQQTLPPTSEAANYYSLRVYLQVQQWKGCADELLPTDWGWHKCGECFVPIQTSLAPAPEEMLYVSLGATASLTLAP